MATSTDMKGNVVKMEVDYSDTVDKRIPECEALAAVRKNRKIFHFLCLMELFLVVHVMNSILEMKNS